MNRSSVSAPNPKATFNMTGYAIGNTENQGFPLHLTGKAAGDLLTAMTRLDSVMVNYHKDDRAIRSLLVAHYDR